MEPNVVMADSPTRNPSDFMKDSGPSRETARSILQRRIDCLDRESLGLKRLASLLEKLPNGSAEEEAMWQLLVTSGKFQAW